MNDILYIALGVGFIILQLLLIRAIFRTAKATESCAEQLRRIIRHYKIPEVTPMILRKPETWESS